MQVRVVVGVRVTTRVIYYIYKMSLKDTSTTRVCVCVHIIQAR